MKEVTRRDVLKTVGIGAATVAVTGVMVRATEGGVPCRISIDAGQSKQTISRHIYGHFAEHLGRCIYEGVWVGENSPIPNTRGIRNDVIAALRRLNIPNLRWPGGCFADTYHWKDGIGPRQQRPTIVNVHWGGVTENNHFGTHEFYDLCSMLGCEPYICGNVGSGTVQEMAEWLEYITMPGRSPMADLRRRNGRDQPWNVKFWAVGNENWGCGGNMRAEYYADEYRRFQTFCRSFGGQPLYKVACGHNDAWNEVLMREAGRHMQGLSVHYYCYVGGSHGQFGAAVSDSAGEWFGLMKSAYGIENFISRTAAIMDKHDPQKRVGMIMDEWGTWHKVEPGTNPGFLYQQNTIRDAVVAGLSLDTMNNHADRIHMANIAQTINVLQAMILTEGPKMLCTPTYHVFEMYKVHQDAQLLPTKMEAGTYTDGSTKIPQVTASCSRDKAGKIHLSMTNMDHERGAEVTAEIKGASLASCTGRILTASTLNAHNTFNQPDQVKPVEFDDFKLSDAELMVRLPARSVVMLEMA
ncbi:MAG: alpha-N-arabinofuranosidase [Bacillota bacterium]